MLAQLKKYDAVIVGAGLSGMYQMIKLRQLGLSARILEMGSDVGGTWYWNRYPGARFDSESYSYGMSFSKELLQEWEWSEHFSSQPETLRYCQYIADKFDLKRDIVFNERVTGAEYDATSKTWLVKTADMALKCRFLITAVGVFSEPTLPAVEGINDFEGEAWHTARWPHEAVDFSGKRVAVIGTGATGVQVIQEVAKTVKSLTVFQRRPNYCLPLGNRLITDKEQAHIKSHYDEIFAQCASTNGAFLHGTDPRSALGVSEEERESFFEKLYGSPGFAFWLGNFRDCATDPEANELVSRFVRKKITERIKDPEMAKKLVPVDHGFGTRRVPMESGYYEVYNQKNVQLIDLMTTPFRRINRTGIETTSANFEFDIIIYATGFDAIVGSFSSMDIRGRKEIKLKDRWANGPVTYLGLQSPGFPNLFTLVGPHNASTFCNIPRCIEQNVEWVSELLSHMLMKGYESVEATQGAADAWMAHSEEMVSMTLIPKTDSWFMNVNENLPEKKRTFLAYAGGAPRYRQKCDEVSSTGYAGFEFT